MRDTAGLMEPPAVLQASSAAAASAARIIVGPRKTTFQQGNGLTVFLLKGVNHSRRSLNPCCRKDFVLAATDKRTHIRCAGLPDRDGFAARHAARLNFELRRFLSHQGTGTCQHQGGQKSGLAANDGLLPSSAADGPLANASDATVVPRRSVIAISNCLVFIAFLHSYRACLYCYCSFNLTA